MQSIKTLDLSYQTLLKNSISQLYPSNPNYIPKFVIHGSGCREKYSLLHLPIFRTAICTALHMLEVNETIAIMITASHNPLSDNGIKIGYVQDRVIDDKVFDEISQCLNCEKKFIKHIENKISKTTQKNDQNTKKQFSIKKNNQNISSAFLGIDCRPSSVELSQIVKQAFEIIGVNLVDIGLCSTPELFSFSKYFIQHKLTSSQANFIEPLIQTQKRSYIAQIQNSFNKVLNMLQKNKNQNPKTKQTIMLDFSNGSGSISFQRYNNLSQNFDFTITNNKNFNEPNYKCGADYFQRNWSLTQTNPYFNKQNYTIFFDGDGDRIIIKIKNINKIFDGNYFVILYIKTLIKINQTLKQLFNTQLNLAVVGISIMNLGLIKELQKYSIPYHSSNIGIQNLFETALKINKTIVFFEPNGHGGIYFDPATLKTIQNLQQNHPNNIQINILSCMHTLLKNNSRGYALHNMLLFFICKKYLEIQTPQSLVSLFEFAQQYIQNIYIKIQHESLFKTNTNNPNLLISPINFINKINEIIQQNKTYFIIIRKSQTQKGLIRINVQGNKISHCKTITQNIIEILQQLNYLNKRKQST